MMIGPMKKKVITSVAVTATILILAFVTVFYLYATKKNEQIATLEEKGKVVQRYVFTRDMLIGEVVTPEDVILVDVKGESAPEDTYADMMLKGSQVIARWDLIDEVTMDPDLYDEAASLYGRRLQVNAKASTIVTSSLFFAEEREPEKDTRLQEFNMVTLPSDLDVGDYIDIRLRFPTGEDYSVLVGKKVYAFGTTTNSNTIFLRLSEEEILRMSSAIIESYIRDGIYLYANRYINPSSQLFEYEYVDYVERYELAKSYFVSGEVTEVNESGELIVVSSGEVIERSVAEIASLINLSEEEVEVIKLAVEEENEDTLNVFRHKLETTEKSIVANYPVKVEVATLLAKNPNVLQEVREKYSKKIELMENEDYSELEKERLYFLDTELTEYDERGELVIKQEYVDKVSENMKTEIAQQKTERQEYLLKLLEANSVSAN